MKLNSNHITKNGQLLNLDFYQKYENDQSKSPSKIITGQQTENNIIVYQAFSPKIAKYAIDHQQFDGANYSFERMSWIKPNFLWMMYRCGWSQKENQERTLAISISKDFFIEVLQQSELSSFSQSQFEDHDLWRQSLANTNVRVQWDPHHDPYGEKENRKAIQIGIKGDLLKEFGTSQIAHIEDITDFVIEQRSNLSKDKIAQLRVPNESEFTIEDKNLKLKLGIT